MKKHFKSAWDYIKRSPFQAMASIWALSITFFVATIIIVLTYGSSQLLAYFETRPQIIAFLKNEASSEAVSALQKKLSGDERLKNVKYVSKDEALTIYKNATTDNPLLGELVSPSIFPSSLEFSVIDLKNAPVVIEELKKEGVVESVGFTASLGSESSVGTVVEKLKRIVLYVKGGGMLLVFGLGITSFIVLTVVIGMRLNVRKGEIETLKLIGATSGFIRAPILVETLIYAVVGVFLGWLAALSLVLYASPTILRYFEGISVLPRDMVQFMALMAIILFGEILAGIFIALGGMYLATSRALAKQ